VAKGEGEGEGEGGIRSRDGGWSRGRAPHRTMQPAARRKHTLLVDILFAGGYIVCWWIYCLLVDGADVLLGLRFGAE